MSVILHYFSGRKCYSMISGRIINKLSELKEAGYECIWKAEPDLVFSTIDVLNQNGYVHHGDHLTTAFKKNDLLFNVRIFPRPHNGEVYGSAKVDMTKLENYIREIGYLEKIIGIGFEIEKISLQV